MLRAEELDLRREGRVSRTRVKCRGKDHAVFDPQGFTKVGGYAGGSVVPTFTLDGQTFDGLTIYQKINGDEIALLPKLDKQKMFRGIVGHRYERIALELSYERTKHNGVFAEVGTGEATFQQMNVDTRIFF